MSKRQFKSQASSGRLGGVGAFGSATFGTKQSSTLSYIQEPPDYSRINDSNVVVAFKNLSKKDSTTKAKALEDLQTALISANTGLEDAVVEAWVKLYPRLSIDNARRVRQLSHTLNGQLSAKLGKRIAPQLPGISGPWLAGTFDVDRAAAKAAQDALTTVFPSSEKVHALRKTFQESILNYCREALLNETVQTLSDERTVNQDDAEATYARVISSSLGVITSLLEHLSSDERSSQQDLYELILSESKLWGLGNHTDANVRRAVHRLIQASLTREPSLIEHRLNLASKAYVYKGLVSAQTGSAIDFVQTLLALTRYSPVIWTDAYTGKKSALSRLQQCLKQGSHSSTGAFWEVMRQLLRELPPNVLPKAYDEAADFLLAIRDGVSRKEERFNASSAWPTYFTLVDLVSWSLSDEQANDLLEAFAMPPVNQYLHPSDESAKWSITGAKSASIVSNVATIRKVHPLMERKWPHLGLKVVEAAKMSAPEQSNEFDKSQKHVAAIGERWAALQRELYAHKLPQSLLQTFADTNSNILSECITLLKNRNGKPYGAAAIIEEQLRGCATNLMSDSTFRSSIVDFAMHDIPRLIQSPSERHLVRCLYALSDEPEFAESFTRTLDMVLTGERSVEEKLGSLHLLYPQNAPSQVIAASKASDRLQNFLQALHMGANIAVVDLVANIMKLAALSAHTEDTILSRLTASLSLDEEPGRSESLSVLDQFTSISPTSIKTFIDSDRGRELLSSMIRLEQAPDEAIADRAASLSAKLSTAIGAEATNARQGIIVRSLEQVSRSSLPIDAVLEMFDKLAAADADSNNDLVPDLHIWEASVTAVMQPPKASLSISSPLAGGVHLVAVDDTQAHSSIQYDAEGLSQALRIAIYLAKQLQRPEFASRLGDEAGRAFTLLNICTLLAEDNISIPGANRLWQDTDSQTFEIDVMDFISDANKALNQYWATSQTGSSFFRVVDYLRDSHPANSPMSYYAALAYSKAHENMFELHGYSSEQTHSGSDMLKSYRAAGNTLALIAHIVGYAQPLTGSQTLTRLCNELIADLTGTSLDGEEWKTIKLLILLNTILYTQEKDILANVQKTRLVFFVKHIISWLAGEATPILKAEVCKALAAMASTMSDMYGEHWSQMIDYVANFWSSSIELSDATVASESGVLLVHVSLRLYDALRKLVTSEEVNDDLAEALRDGDRLRTGLIHLLRSANGVPDENHQPLMVTNELLAREISLLPVKPLPQTEELFPLLYSPSHAIQGAAFDLLHKQIPTAQEQISFDAALDNKIAHLPDELLSLIIDAPTLDSLADASFQRSMPLSLQGFLYSWRLLFDHFTGSSYRVKSDYIEQLKEGGYLSGLLDLVFDFLGHTRGRAVDASKFDIQHYVADADSSPERDVQWLLTHLYYLALFTLPSLVKSYFLDVRSRQTSQTIETWTAKHISPLIIEASLRSVAEWAEKSVKDDPDYENMTVKVGMRSREVNVSYLVDEQTMAIKVILPETYPLDSAKVASVSRVAVKEEKWQSWLRNCQGVITFSNGSITDGLSAWRKNVTGTLKGQTECAICYSIISGDKQLPTKRCPTCKNLFHSSCLLKWFKTSNASTCPLCRNPFNFN